MSKEVLLLHGWGLNNDVQLKTLLSANGIGFESFDLDFDAKAPQLDNFGTVICSGPMGTVLSDKLLTAKQALAFKKLFEKQNPAKLKKTRFYGLGRGGYLFLATQLWGPLKNNSAPTKDSRGHSPWRKVTLIGSESKNVMGLELCERQWDSDSEYFKRLTTWISSENRPCGWVVGENLHVSTVDILAVKEASILSEYGYFDSSTISTVADFLDKIVS